MHFLQKYNKKVVKYDLINKYRYDKVKNVPELQKIALNFGCKNFSIQRFATTLLALEIVGLKKGTLSVSKNANILLKIQKGMPAGCEVVLKKKEIDNFLIRLHLEVLPKLRNFLGFSLQEKVSTFSFKLSNNELVLPELQNQYPLFLDLPRLDIHILTNSRNQKELLFLVKSMKFPLSAGN